MELTAKNVMDVLSDCFYTSEEVAEKGVDKLTEEAIKVEGISTNFGFHPARVEKHKEDIRSMLTDLPATFMKDGGGGMSFLNACITKNGHQWGEHRDMEALFCLGEAAGFVNPCTPRDMWDVLPGGMPYYVVDLSE